MLYKLTVVGQAPRHFCRGNVKWRNKGNFEAAKICTIFGVAFCRTFYQSNQSSCFFTNIKLLEIYKHIDWDNLVKVTIMLKFTPKCEPLTTISLNHRPFTGWPFHPWTWPVETTKQFEFEFEFANSWVFEFEFDQTIFLKLFFKLLLHQTQTFLTA